MSTVFPRATLYQPGFRHFISFKKNGTSETIPSVFFLSFEDALWAVCQQQLKEGALFLVPAFYCMEVVEELLKRGYRVEFYPVLKDLRADENGLLLRLRELEPAVCIIYHPLGADSGMVINSELLNMNSGTFFIEDCAHRLLNPLEISIVGENHLVIDSLRKVTPFLGSRLFGVKKIVTALQTETTAGVLPDRFRVVVAYRLWRTVFHAASMLRILFLWKLSEQLFENFNSRIGTLLTPQWGPGLSRAAVNMINVRDVKSKKAQIGALYHTSFSDTQSLTTIELTPGEIAELKCYPILLERSRAEALTGILEARGIYVDAIFPDSPACKTRCVIGLPIDISLASSSYNYIVKTVLESVMKLEQEKI